MFGKNNQPRDEQAYEHIPETQNAKRKTFTSKRAERDQIGEPRKGKPEGEKKMRMVGEQPSQRCHCFHSF
jgi:hypothetical protein